MTDLGAESRTGRAWFVTGACGTVGREIVRQLASLSPARVVGIDNNESELFFMKEELREDPRFSFFVCDLRDRAELITRMRGCDIVVHTAGLKHVILCEQSPNSAIVTNIIGTQSVLDAATEVGVERLLFTSSDKAVNPTNVMGASKLMAEKLVCSANAYARRGKQVFAATRFGNVLGSRGSVLQVFYRQIASGGPVTLTDPAMTRFIMSLSDAVKLVLDSVFLARGGEILVTKMPVVRIADLAAVMIEELAPNFGRSAGDIKILQIGSKPGEKFFEELMNQEEIRRTIELRDYFVIAPALRAINRDIQYTYPGVVSDAAPAHPYNSSTIRPMDREALRQYLRTHSDLLRQ